MAKTRDSSKRKRLNAYRLATLSRRLTISLVLTFGAVIALYPVLFTVMTSLKTRKGFAVNPYGVPLDATFGNYTDAFSRLHLGSLMLNSFASTLGGVLLVTIVSIMAAYAVTKLRFPGRNIVFLVIIGTLMIPNQTILFPFYQTMNSLDLTRKLYGLIIAFGAFGLPLGTYLMAAYFKSIPDELVEAAVVDGANHFQVLWRVMLPISMPAVVTLGILNSVWMWNDLLLPLLIMPARDHTTLMVAISLFRGDFDIHVPLVSAGLVIGMLPIIIAYLSAQTQLIKGLTAGAVK